MATKPRLLAFAGSLRAASYNRLLIRILAEAARKAGAEVSLIDLHDYPLPVYDGDIEAAGMPDPVRALQSQLAEHDGLLISSPEYNGSLPALVKNTLDWISRPLEDGSPGTGLYRGKVAGICSASPGALGGLRGLLVLRDALAKLGLWVAPSQVAIGRAGNAFDSDGSLTDDQQLDALGKMASEVVQAALAFRPGDNRSVNRS